MPLGTEIGLRPGDIVRYLWRSSFLPRKGAHTFRAISIVAKRSRISATAELLFSHCYGWLFPPCPQRAPSAFQF